MPELPEVETVLRTLETQIKDRKIVDVKVLWNNIIIGDVDIFKNDCLNQHFREFQRVGKYLLFKMDSKMLIIHLRMEGKFYIMNKNDPIEKHIHVIFTLDDGRELRYHDTRKFGKMVIYELDDQSQYPAISKIGYDVFDERLDIAALYEKWHTRTLPVKQVLLDQSFMAGIGNIYADEICFSARLHPETKMNRCSRSDFDKILLESRRILNGAIKSGGTTIRSYTSSLGVTGRFQLQLKVHQRAEKECLQCGTIIKKIKVAGRGTYLCPTCQRKK